MYVDANGNCVSID